MRQKCCGGRLKEGGADKSMSPLPREWASVKGVSGSALFPDKAERE